MDEDSSMKWLPCQSVHDVIIAVADNIPRSPWEWIGVYQGHAAIEENMPLGFLADGDGTVHLTVERVTEIYDPKARAALSQADICANAGQWDSWRRWQAEARRLEKGAREAAIHCVSERASVGT